jgi:hypothetical protein
MTAYLDSRFLPTVCGCSVRHDVDVRRLKSGQDTEITTLFRPLR